MTTQKHTPGPYVAEYDEMGGYDCITAAYAIKGKAGQTVAVIDLANYQVYGAGNSGDATQRAKEEEAKANARLLATAPELLAALQRALPWLGRLIAEGAHLQCVAPNDAIGAMQQAEAAIAKATG